MLSLPDAITAFKLTNRYRHCKAFLFYPPGVEGPSLISHTAPHLLLPTRQAQRPLRGDRHGAATACARRARCHSCAA